MSKINDKVKLIKDNIKESEPYKFFEFTSDGVPRGVNSPGKKLVILVSFLVVAIFYLISIIETGLSDLITDVQIDIEALPFYINIPTLDTNILNDMARVFGKFMPPNLNYVEKVWPKLAETLQMAIIATTFAAIAVIPFSVLGAANVTTNKYLNRSIKFLLNIVRTIPDIILAVVFVALFGIGAFSGIIALTIFSFGILAKLLSESIETIDMNPIDAIYASGANKIQTIWYAVIPQVLPNFVSYALYVFEINVRASIILGLVGAGGIGQLLNERLKWFQYPDVMMIVIVIFVVVILLDVISNRIRRALV
ncbi:phosphonate ABC transporter, permease protein PhnE [Haloplasma contractile]|uniref:Phosphonates transport system permease protein phnE n=1 Tax=Haloplasma contractile SSD-17B TaxID=1033810 RepID=F7Q0T6_9MOLU|nr:phosphonate ABC transporter, permease protein PhnE [Haloplasma contractile]ERJ11309.1 Phosphonates transport system permease protein phnE [Haloplasma contractile SSD-17B]